MLSSAKLTKMVFVGHFLSLHRQNSDISIMRKVGKVTVELLDGKGYGRRTLTIGNWVGKAYFAPKSELAPFLEGEECNKPGVYCLKYFHPTNGKELVYIGEADSIRNRLRAHFNDPQKGTFTEVMFFVSLNDWLTKTQVKYLEHRLVTKASEIKAPIRNQNIPARPNIQIAELNDLEDFLDCILLLLSVMGFRFMLGEGEKIVSSFDFFTNEDEEDEDGFQPPIPLIKAKTRTNIHDRKIKQVGKNFRGKDNLSGSKPTASPPQKAKRATKQPIQETKSELPLGKYSIMDNYVEATMDVIEGKFTVRAGSQAKKRTSASIDHRYIKIREKLLQDGVLIDDGDYYLFTRDHSFSSSSAASNVVVGRQSPGPRMWVDKDNRSLRGIVNDSLSR